MAHQCRQLKTKRLSTAGRHQHKQIPPRECILNDFPLQRPEVVVAEMSLQRGEQIHCVSIEQLACCAQRICAITGDGLEAVTFPSLRISQAPYATESTASILSG